MNKITGLLAKIKGKRVYFATNSIIYFIEQVAPFYEIVSPLFDEIGMENIAAFTSEFTLTKTNKKIFIQAAELGGQYGLRTADAIHFASAIENRCHYLVTNDKKFKSNNGVQVVILSDYVNLAGAINAT